MRTRDYLERLRALVRSYRYAEALAFAERESLRLKEPSST